MKINLTYNGKTQVIDNVSIGGQVKVEYITSEGKKMIYYIKVTNSEKMVMN